MKTSRIGAVPAGIASRCGPPALALRQRHQTWEMDSYSDFVHGHFAGVSLSREGRLSLAPKIDTVFASDQPVIWSVAEAPRDSLRRHGQSRPPLSGRPRRQILAAVDRPPAGNFRGRGGCQGTVYAGTSPDGKVYSHRQRGKAE